MNFKKLKEKENLILFIVGVLFIALTIITAVSALSSRTYARFVSPDLILRWVLMLLVGVLYSAAIVYAALPSISDNKRFQTGKSFLFLAIAELFIVIVAGISLIEEFQTSLNLLEDATYLFAHFILIIVALIGKTFNLDSKKTALSALVAVVICLLIFVLDMVCFATPKEAYRTVDFTFVMLSLSTSFAYVCIFANGLLTVKLNKEHAEEVVAQTEDCSLEDNDDE